MKNQSQSYFRLWRAAVIAIGLAFIAYYLFFHNIAHLLPGYSLREVNTYNAASNWHTILNNPLDAPYKMLILIAVATGHHSWLATRIAAACFGVLLSAVFFIVVRGWYGYRVGLLTTVMFITSGGLLHAARLGTPAILQMSLLLFIGALFWIRRTEHPTLLSYVMVIAFALLWYVPGLIWFELLAFVLLRKGITHQVSRTGWLHRSGWAATALVLLAPLLYAFYKSPALIRGFAGLPNHFAPITQMLANVGNAVLSLGIRSPLNPVATVGHAPVLNIVELILFILGLYLLIKKYYVTRSIGILSALLLALILIFLGGPVRVTTLVPLVYLCIAGGLALLIKQWLRVFPRNPIAQGVGVTLVVVMIFFSILYQWRSYFVAWPHNVAVRQTFDREQP